MASYTFCFGHLGASADSQFHIDVLILGRCTGTAQNNSLLDWSISIDLFHSIPHYQSLVHTLNSCIIMPTMIKPPIDGTQYTARLIRVNAIRRAFCEYLIAVEIT